jgi:glycosidase
MPVFWQPGGRPPLRAIYRDLIKLRKTHDAFVNNDVLWLTNTVPDSIVSFIRRDARDEYLILINLSSRRVAASVDLPGGAATFEPVKITGRADPIDIVLPDFHLNGYGWFIYHRAVSK